MKYIFKYIKFIIILLHIVIINPSCVLLDDNRNINYTPTLVDVDNILNDDSEYIIVLGDIQEYTNNKDYAEYLGHTMNWIWSQVKHGKNIKCVLQTGDITWYNLRHQYEVFLEYTTSLASLIPYISCPGNHDYEYGGGSIITDRYSTLFSEFTQFAHVRNRIVNQFEPDRMENIIVSNYIGGKRYDIISLEFGPRIEVIEWVRNHIQANPDNHYIFMTHEFLTNNGNIVVTGSSYGERQLQNTTVMSPEQIWNQLIKDNNNILCVLCGHNGFSAHNISVNSAGREVYQILFNLQYQENGGDGWIQIWEFPNNKDYVNINTYNTIYRQYYPGDNHSFNFKYKY